jgi:hypothetical protein
MIPLNYRLRPREKRGARRLLRRKHSSVIERVCKKMHQRKQRQFNLKVLLDAIRECAEQQAWVEQECPVQEQEPTASAPSPGCQLVAATQVNEMVSSQGAYSYE